MIVPHQKDHLACKKLLAVHFLVLSTRHFALPLLIPLQLVPVVQEADANERARNHVAHLSSGPEEQRLRAALALRDMAGNPAQKGAVRDAGGVEALLAVLDGGYRQPQTIVAAEALSCLAVDDMLSRVRPCAATCIPDNPESCMSRTQEYHRTSATSYPEAHQRRWASKRRVWHETKE